jgi:DNA-binding protein HU-beta
MAKAATKKVNRTELIDAISMSMGISKTQAEKFLNTFVAVVTEKLTGGFEVNITGFGSFRVVTRRARKGTNPKTRQPMQIPPSTSVTYTVGKTLKEEVRSKKK